MHKQNNLSVPALSFTASNTKIKFRDQQNGRQNLPRTSIKLANQENECVSAGTRRPSLLVQDFQTLQSGLKSLELANKQVVDRIHRARRNLMNVSTTQIKGDTIVFPSAANWQTTPNTDRTNSKAISSSFQHKSSIPDHKPTTSLGLEDLTMSGFPRLSTHSKQNSLKRKSVHIQPFKRFAQKKYVEQNGSDEHNQYQESAQLKKTASHRHGSPESLQRQTKHEQQCGDINQKERILKVKYEEAVKSNGYLRFQVWMLKDLLEKQLKHHNPVGKLKLRQPSKQRNQTPVQERKCEVSVADLDDIRKMLSHQLNVPTKMLLLTDQIASYQTRLKNVGRLIQNLKERLRKQQLEHQINLQGLTSQIFRLKHSLILKDQEIEAINTNYNDILRNKKDQLTKLHNQLQGSLVRESSFRTQINQLQNNIRTKQAQLARVNEILKSQVKMIENASAQLEQTKEVNSIKQAEYRLTIEELKRELMLRESQVKQVTLTHLVQHPSCLDISAIKQKQLNNELEKQRSKYQTRIAQLEQKISEAHFEIGLDKLLVTSGESIAERLKEAEKINSQLRQQIAKLTSETTNTATESHALRMTRTLSKFVENAQIQIPQPVQAVACQDAGNTSIELASSRMRKKILPQSVKNLQPSTEHWVHSKGTLMMNWAKDFSLSLSADIIDQPQDLNVEEIFNRPEYPFESLQLSQQNLVRVFQKVAKYVSKLQYDIKAKNRKIHKLHAQMIELRVVPQADEGMDNQATNQDTYSDFNENYSVQVGEYIAKRPLVQHKMERQTFEMIQSLLSQVETLHAELAKASDQEARMRVAHRQQTQRLRELLKGQMSPTSNSRS